MHTVTEKAKGDGGSAAQKRRAAPLAYTSMLGRIVSHPSHLTRPLRRVQLTKTSQPRIGIWLKGKEAMLWGHPRHTLTRCGMHFRSTQMGQCNGFRSRLWQLDWWGFSQPGWWWIGDGKVRTTLYTLSQRLDSTKRWQATGSRSTGGVDEEKPIPYILVYIPNAPNDKFSQEDTFHYWVGRLPEHAHVNQTYPDVVRMWSQFHGCPASGGGIERVFFSAGKQHDVLKKRTMDKTLETTLKASINTTLPTCDDTGVFTWKLLCHHKSATSWWWHIQETQVVPPFTSYQPPDTVDYLRFLYVSSSSSSVMMMTHTGNASSLPRQEVGRRWKEAKELVVICAYSVALVWLVWFVSKPFVNEIIMIIIKHLKKLDYQRVW